MWLQNRSDLPPQELASGGDFQIVDVREPVEWRAGHIEGAIHIPLGDLSSKMGEIALDRPVATICRSGSRSARAARLLGERGYTVRNVRGGIKAWHAAGLPIVSDDGHPRVG